MIDATLALEGPVGVTVLLIVSFLSMLTGLALRKWPERVRSRLEDIDGSSLLLTPQAYRALTKGAGTGLLYLSFVALLAMAFV
jgi:hypothetical protein